MIVDRDLKKHLKKGKDLRNHVIARSIWKSLQDTTTALIMWDQFCFGRFWRGTWQAASEKKCISDHQGSCSHMGKMQQSLDDAS